MRIGKKISIPENIYKDIKKRQELIGFNFSDWIIQKYKEDFAPDSIYQEIEKHQNYINYLKSMADKAEENKRTYEIALNRNEIRFLESVPRKIYEGYDIRALHKLFCNTFVHEISLQVFKNWVDYYDKRNK